MFGVLGFAFAAGVLATMNPCGFALLPAYIVRGLDRRTVTSRMGSPLGRALSASALTSCGFLVVFAPAGGIVALGARTLTTLFPWAGMVIGLLMAATGLTVIGGRHLGLRLPPLPLRHPPARSGDFLFGVCYGISSLSCALPVFLSAMGGTLAASLPVAGLGFVAYALGMGTLLAGLSVAAVMSGGALARVLRRRLLPHFDRVSGAMLLIAGAYLVHYYWVTALRPGGTDALVSGAGDLSARLDTAMASTAGTTAVGLALLALAPIAAWSLRAPLGLRALVRRLDAVGLPGGPGSRALMASGLAVVLAVTAAGLTTSNGGPANGAGGLDRRQLRGFLEPSAPAPAFALRDQSGRLVSLLSLRGHPVVIAFLYSQCQEICPLTAPKLRAAQRQLGSLSGQVDWLTISVSPQTDTAASVHAFSEKYGLLGSWRYLDRPIAADLATLKAFGIQPELNPSSPDPRLQHSAYVLVLDQQGRRLESFPDEMLQATDLAHDLRLLLGRPQGAHTPIQSPLVASGNERSGGQSLPSPTVSQTGGVLSMTGADVRTGAGVDLARWAGRPMVVNVYASWCSGCAAEAPALAAFARAHPGVPIVGIDVEDQRQPAMAFIERYRLDFPSIWDEQGRVVRQLDVLGLPTTIFLSPQHHEIKRIVGETDLAGFETGLQAAAG